MTTARNSARLRALRVPAVLAIAMLGSLVVSPAASAAPLEVSAQTECTGTIGAETVGSLVVPDGETCVLNGTTVEGSVTLGTGSSLITDDATITRNVIATKDPDRVELIDTDVLLNIFITGATGRITIGTEGCAVDPAVGNNLVLRNNRAPIAICQMTIGENLRLVNNKRSIGVFDNEVGNNLIARGNDGDALRLRDNVVGTSGGGSIQIDDNNADKLILLVRNSATIHIDCDGNTPDPTGFDNSAGQGLTGQCATLDGPK